VDFVPTDIFPTLSGAPRDGGVRPVRDETPPRSGSSRKGFSSMLRSVRDEVGKATIREAEGARPVNKADDGSRAKETKGLNESTQPERSYGSSSQVAERTRSDNNDDKNTDDAESNRESSPQRNDVGSGSQEQGTAPLSTLISSPAEPQVVDQKEVQTETESHPFNDVTDLETDSQQPLISPESTESFTTTPDVIGVRSFTNSAGVASHSPVTQQSNLGELQTNNDGPEVQGVEGAAAEVVNESEKVAPDHGDSSSTSRDSFLRSAHSLEGLDIPHVVQAHVGTTPLEGKALGAKHETLKYDGSPVDHSAPLPAAQHMPVLGDHDALGASMQHSFSQRQEPGSDGSAQLRELWSGHNGRQMENGEPKIPQVFGVSHPIANGSVAETVVPGTASQTTSSPGTPVPASFVTHVQSGAHAEETAQSAGNPAMRSVVVNVNQPDLGHVHIRIAMTNDLVHTHFSSDRLEVGQFFINSQDRLQAALQASGLDMGQFRVDIDRQSGGRSFQQSSSQEHGQSWNQGSHGMGRESHSDQQDHTRGVRHGLLNVVA
jgi:hypothetical protein